MTQYLVIASFLILLGLLIHGRFSTATLFTVWAGGYFLFGLIDEKSFLSSYANPALVTLVMLLLVSLVLERSTLLHVLIGGLLRGRPALATVRLTSVAMCISAFVSNTAVVGAFLGMINRQRVVPPSKLLLPLSYASILGGIITLIGTSTNLVVNTMMVDAGLPAMGIFQITAIGLPVAVVSLVALWTCARWLPAHPLDENGVSRAYFLEAKVSPGSPIIGRSVEENHLRHLNGLFLAEIVRGGRLLSPAEPDEVLQQGDVLIFSGDIENVHALQQFAGLELFDGRTDALLDSNLVEVVLSNQSELPNRTLRDVDFRTMFDAAVVGIRRGDKRLNGQLGRIPLRVGDSLLLAAGRDFFHHRNLDRNFHVVYGGFHRPQLSHSRSALTIGGFSLVILATAMEWMSLFTGLLGLLAILLGSRTLTLGEVRRRFPFELVLLVGASLTIAKVIESTGTALLVADAMKAMFSGFGVTGALIGVYAFTLVLTELISNNAAAAIAFPIGLSAAKAFGLDPMPFLLAVLFGASASFIVPFGYQPHLMVYSPGRYRFTDFMKVGVPVSFVYSITVILLLIRQLP